MRSSNAPTQLSALDLRALLKPRLAALSGGFLLLAVSRVCLFVLPASTQYFVDDVIGHGRLGTLRWLIAVVIGAALLQGLASFLTVALLASTTQDLIVELRRKVHAHVMRLPIAFFDASKTGVLLSRIMNDVESVRNLVGAGLVEFAGSLLGSGIAVILLCRINLLMTAVSLSLMAGFFVGVKRGLRSLQPSYTERSCIMADVIGRLTEALDGARVVKIYRAELREEQVFLDGISQLRNNIYRTARAAAALGASAPVIMGIGGSVILYLGARNILHGALTLGEFVKFIALLSFAATPAFQVAGIGAQISEAAAGIRRVRELLSIPPEDRDTQRTIEIAGIRGHVVLQGVGFSYDGVCNVVHDISLQAPPGTVTALVGPSGSGKSTVIGLIAAFYKPTSGVITVDGVDLSRVCLASYRAQLAAVLQDTFLFDGTIRDNVAYSRPHASEYEIQSACRMARVDEFAERMPARYDTMVGAHGVRLSGGQRQRISIARAILADPRILILDEATSNLDSESEALIQESLSYLMAGRTTFVIAHRLSTVRSATQILYIEDGRILERGSHEFLYALGGRYFDLCHRQQNALESNIFAERRPDIGCAGYSPQSATAHL